MTNRNNIMPMFSYSFSIILLLFFIIIAIIIYLIVTRIRKAKSIVIVKPQKKDLLTIKQNYLIQLDELQTNRKNNKITNRKSYQELSKIIRNFVYEVTQIKVPYYSLEEIKQVNIIELTKLVEEYYHPEFAKESKGKIDNSIRKTREVIEKWQ